jgi:TfoX/Sxy family transcriptional regulator of competence genes
MRAKPTRRRMSTKGPPARIDPAFAAVVEAFATDRRVTQGKLMASYGLKVNGRIFAMLVRGQLVTKLPKSRVDELVASGRGERFDPGHGRLMKEWIAIRSSEAEWVTLAQEAFAFVRQARGGA